MLIGVFGNARRTERSVGTRKSAALKRAALAGRHAPERVRTRREVVAVVVGSVGREPVPGVEAVNLLRRLLGDQPRPVGRAINARVVHDDDLVVARDADVELEHVGTGADRLAERVQRVGRGLVLAALVRDVEHPPLQPGVRRPAGGRRRRVEADQRGNGDEDHEAAHPGRHGRAASSIGRRGAPESFPRRSTASAIDPARELVVPRLVANCVCERRPTAQLDQRKNPEQHAHQTGVGCVVELHGFGRCVTVTVELA
jgi:hypothetical protein